VTRTFFDTSILLAGLIDFGEPSAAAQTVMTAIAEGAIRGPHTAWHCCLEFYAVSTRLPEEYRLSPADSLRLIEEEILARFRVRQLSDRDRRRFLRSAAQDRAAGGRIYDAHIAEIARLAGARTVVTDNRRHFTTLLRYDIRVLTTQEFAIEARVWSDPGSDQPG
jgi:predicted nucleic acid-binding protein